MKDNLLMANYNEIQDSTSKPGTINENNKTPENFSLILYITAQVF